MYVHRLAFDDFCSRRLIACSKQLDTCAGCFLSHLVNSVFVPDNASKHGRYILRVCEGDELISVQG